ncbi:MAG: class I poly(R)-hydroxyalkanoic acid synthase [Burkholderiales bacterium]|nr:class I poly(R)-hydroxyalkanoic acid synthase [Burkholderiales bacterium]
MATPQPPASPTPPTPEELAEAFAQITRQSQRVAAEFLERAQQGKAALPADDVGVTDAFMELTRKLMANPMVLAEAQMRLWHDGMRLWHAAMARWLGGQPEPVVDAKADNRFKNEAWQNNFLFDYIKQSYLLASQNIQRTVSEVEGLDPQTARKVRFFTRQFVDALAPTNFVFTNPEVLKATVDSGGRNLIDGLQHLLGDLERGGGQLAISMTDYSAFRLGENVATAPGKVVYQNDLMQLIQYTPSTETVWKTPLLIIPPWINKYYILDLREKNSFIRWAVAQGHTLFVISWVNPDERLAHKGFDDYMREGPLAALEAIEQATGEKEANVIGYCLGGTLLACTLAWLGIKGRRPVKSATFFTAMIDFSEPGELGVFVDENVLSNLEKKMEERGYLEGAEMAGTFNLLRANDLIWSFVINNYLLGKDPFPFDLLFWNSDSTRMPARMHTFYLRNMYIRNALVQPGAIELDGEPIDLGNIRVPSCFISTMEDHIAPWKSTFLGARRMPGPVKFILGGSGHIAGVVNPPAANKYQYWTSEGALPDSADEWLAQAQRTDGSWWPAWNEWVTQFSGARVPARVPGSGKLKVIEDAPGAYAKLRLDAQGTAAPPVDADTRPSAGVPEAANDPAALPVRAMPAKAGTTPGEQPTPTLESTIDLLSAAADAQPSVVVTPPSATTGIRRTGGRKPAGGSDARRSKPAGKGARKTH